MQSSSEVHHADRMQYCLYSVFFLPYCVANFLLSSEWILMIIEHGLAFLQSPVILNNAKTSP